MYILYISLFFNGVKMWNILNKIKNFFNSKNNEFYRQSRLVREIGEVIFDIELLWIWDNHSYSYISEVGFYKKINENNIFSDVDYDRKMEITGEFTSYVRIIRRHIHDFIKEPNSKEYKEIKKVLEAIKNLDSKWNLNENEKKGVVDKISNFNSFMYRNWWNFLSRIGEMQAFSENIRAFINIKEWISKSKKWWLVWSFFFWATILLLQFYFERIIWVETTNIENIIYRIIISWIPLYFMLFCIIQFNNDKRLENWYEFRIWVISTTESLINSHWNNYLAGLFGADKKIKSLEENLKEYILKKWVDIWFSEPTLNKNGDSVNQETLTKMANSITDMAKIISKDK